MPKATFRSPSSPSPRQAPHRSVATFRDGQSPLPSKQRRFGTDITNRAGARPVFKPGQPPRAQEPLARPLAGPAGSPRAVTPVKFVAVRGEPDTDCAPAGSPGHAPPTPLATLIEARCLELRVQPPRTEAVAVDLTAVEAHNAVCALTATAVILNPGQIPLEHARIHRYGEHACIAGLW